jgi:hypothetical protein
VLAVCFVYRPKQIWKARRFIDGVDLLETVPEHPDICLGKQCHGHNSFALQGGASFPRAAPAKIALDWLTY